MSDPLDTLCRVLWRVMTAKTGCENNILAATDDDTRQAHCMYLVAYTVVAQVLELIIKEGSDGSCDNSSSRILQ